MNILEIIINKEVFIIIHTLGNFITGVMHKKERALYIK